MNYYGKFRTSYFQPTDNDALRNWCDQIGVRMEGKNREDDTGLVMLMSGDDEAGIPTSRPVSEEDSWDVEEMDFLSELAGFIPPDWLVEVDEVGSEGMRYLTAAAYLVGSDGIVSDVSFFGFQAGAQDYADSVGKSLTPCQY